MEKGVRDGKPETKISRGPLEVEEDEDHLGGEDESDSLLPPSRSRMSRKPEKAGRKVQWNDSNGDKLFEVLEFQPSDMSDSEDEDSDSCICTVM